jgi:transposase
MAISTPNLYPVILDDEQRRRLVDISKNGRAPAKKIQHAQVLLMSDRNRDGGPLSRSQVAELLGIHVNSVDRIRKRFVLEGEAPAVNRKARLTPPIAPKLDGHAEAFLIATCCGRAPKGRTRWTLALLAEELKKNRFVTTVCAETVRKTLKKTNCNLGGSSAGVCRSGTTPGSSPKWKKSTTSTPPNTRKRNR